MSEQAVPPSVPTSVICLEVAEARVAAFCDQYGLAVPSITVVGLEVIGKDGSEVFGQCFSADVVVLYRGSFQRLYDRTIASPLVTSQPTVRSVLSQQASKVLLRELYHCRQIAKGEHEGMSREQVEAAATAFY